MDLIIGTLLKLLLEQNSFNLTIFIPSQVEGFSFSPMDKIQNQFLFSVNQVLK